MRNFLRSRAFLAEVAREPTVPPSFALALCARQHDGHLFVAEGGDVGGFRSPALRAKLRLLAQVGVDQIGC